MDSFDFFVIMILVMVAGTALGIMAYSVYVNNPAPVRNVYGRLENVTLTMGKDPHTELEFQDKNNTTYSAGVEAELYDFFEAHVGDWFKLGLNAQGDVISISLVNETKGVSE